MLAKVVAHAPTREQAARKLAGVAGRGPGSTACRPTATSWSRSCATSGSCAGEVSTACCREIEVPETDPGLAPAAAALALAERAREARTVQRGLPVAWRNVVEPAAGDLVRGRRRRVVGPRGYVVDGAPSSRPARPSVTLEADGVRTTYAVAVVGDAGRRRLARRPRRAAAYAAVRGPRRRGRERQPARADARHRGQRRGRAGRAGRGRPAGARARGDEDAAHRPRAERRHGDARSTYSPVAQVAAGEVLAVVEETE